MYRGLARLGSARGGKVRFSPFDRDGGVSAAVSVTVFTTANIISQCQYKDSALLLLWGNARVYTTGSLRI